MAGRVSEPAKPRSGRGRQFAENSIGELDGIVAGSGGFVGVGKGGSKVGSSIAIGCRRVGHASQERSEGKVSSVIATRPAQVIEAEAKNLRVRIEVATRLLAHRIRAKLHHAKRNHGARKSVAAVFRAVHGLHVGCQALQRVGPERQAQPHDRSHGQCQQSKFFPAERPRIMAMRPHSERHYYHARAHRLNIICQTLTAYCPGQRHGNFTQPTPCRAGSPPKPSNRSDVGVLELQEIEPSRN